MVRPFALLASLCSCLLACHTGWCADRELPPAANHQVDFASEIQPLFVRYCFSCHGPDEQKSNFRLDDRAVAFRGGDFGEPPIVAGKSDQSPLLQYIAGLDADLKMPPNGVQMTAGEIGLIRAWIEQGANWPEKLEIARPKLTTDHWSFQPVKIPTVPGDANHLSASRSPIDAFIEQRLHAAGLDFSQAAAPATLVRRLYLDVLGIPPTPEEIERFANDTRPDAYERLVDQLLASPRYGERWARHWLDVVRFAESNGFETNIERPNAWRYRDYVIDALNRDLPYDRFVFEQIAGDAVGADAATGFIVGGPWDKVKSPDPVLTAMQRSDELADMTNTTATAFLGLTIGCARCHNHKFDPLLQTDYYALQAVFAGVQHGDRPIAKVLAPAEEARLAEGSRKLAELQANLAQLQTAPRHGRHTFIDDERPWQPAGKSPGTEILAKENGHGINPPGKQRGERDDPGDWERLPNVSRGRYLWWTPEPGKDLFAYHPLAAGKQRVWLSWGCGWQTHTTDAQYVLDLDGDRNTVDDQQVIFTADQQLFAGGVGKIVSRPLWSGFADAGVHELRSESTILLRGGETGTAITADVIVLEEVSEDGDAADAPLQPALRAPTNSKENVERFPAVAARFIRFTIDSTMNNSEPCVDELEVFTVARPDLPSRNIALNADVRLTSSGNYAGNPFHKLEHINDGKYGNSFSWISNSRGTGWVQLELPEPALIDRIVWGRDRDEKYQDRTAVHYQIEVATVAGEWQLVASSNDRLSAAVDAKPASNALVGLSPANRKLARQWLEEQQHWQDELKPLQEKPLAYAGNFVTPPATHRLMRGDPMLPKEEVAPDCFAVLGTLGLKKSTAEQERRVALANWLISADNPLTPRVISNRVWQYHFGTGLVDTPSDLGVNGTRPSHPELLDWLAAALIADGWSLKSLHREVLSSHTYQQSSAPKDAGWQTDAQCRLLWRYPARRLSAEAIRDSMLAVSGNLDLQMHGPGWSTFKPNSNYVRVYDPKEEFGPDEWRRAIYMQKVRMRQDGVFGVFDCPDGGQIAPKRSRSTTALQALSLFNSPFVLQQAEIFSQRIISLAHDDPEQQAKTAFALTFGRDPAADELTAAKALIAEHGLPALCRALFNANEFLFIP